MGASNPIHDNEKPVHTVTLSNYSIGETEVTQALWQAVMGANPSSHKDPNCPVEHVIWDDCQKFIQKLNVLTGKSFRLPTEAEWEYAARGGCKSKGYQYAGSNDLELVAWCSNNSSDQTHPVKTKVPNELGIYDMSGNVGEWCQDWYGPYSSAAVTNPKGGTTGVYRVIRDGNYSCLVKFCRVVSRDHSNPRAPYQTVGLRLAL
jgi:formylglycine-generating enzyme required for sulfatase activity